MRRATSAMGAAALVVMVLAGATSVAQAAPVGGPPQVNTFVGTSDFGGPGCSFIHQTFDATYGLGRHPGTLHLEGCVTLVTPVSFTYDATFAITAPDGRHITGTATGTVGDSTSTGCPTGRPPAALAFTLQPTTGTLTVAGALRPFELTGVWCGGTPGGAVQGTFSLATG